MKHLFALLTIAVFALGVGVGGFLSLELPAQEHAEVQSYSTTNRALSFNSIQTNEISSAQTQPLQPKVEAANYEGPIERISPGDWIKERQIEMRPDGVFVKFNNPQWAILADTNSMDPVFDDTSHLIQTVPLSKEEITIGDIVSYDSPIGFPVVHRVIEIGTDEEGWYAILKGDNNPTPDPWKVRFDMVRRVTVMVVY